MNTFLIFLLFIFISLSHTQPKTFNDTKCDLFGSMLLKHFISKEPYSSNFTDMYKLLQSSGTAIGDLGNYYECQKISYAKYFVLTAELSGYKQSIGFCYYKECDEIILKNAVTKIINLANKYLDIAFDPNKIVIQDTSKELEAFRVQCVSGFYSVISIMGILLILPLLQYICKRKKKENECVYCLSFFNIKNNFIEMFAIEKPNNNTYKYLKVLHGVRVLTSGWIVLGETFYLPIYYVKNMADMYYLAKKWYFNLVSGAFFAVDVFFFLSGFLFYFNLSKKSNTINSRYNLLTSFFDRYFRLLPLYLVMIFGITSITPFIVDGPNYQMMQTLNGGCVKNWWHNLIFINNIIKYDTENNKICVQQLWFLACNFQFFMVCLLIIFFCYNHKKIKHCLLIAIYCGSIIAQIYTMIYYDFKYNDVEHPGHNDPLYTAYYFVLPWDRITPYIIGIYFSHLFVKTKLYKNDYCNKKEKEGFTDKVNNYLETNDWACYLLFIFGFGLINLTFWTSSIANFRELSKLGNALCQAFTKDIFVIGLGIILHLTYLGKFSLITKILSKPFFEIISKGTYGIYLYHTFLLDLIFYEYGNVFYMHVPDYVILALGAYILSYFLSLGCTVLVERPFNNLTKKVFRGKEEKEKELKKNEEEVDLKLSVKDNEIKI